MPQNMDSLTASTYLVQLYSYYFKKVGLQEDYREAIALAIAALMRDSDCATE